jgi:hypothetical protein
VNATHSTTTMLSCHRKRRIFYFQVFVLVFELSVGDFYYNAVILNTIMMKYLFPVMILLSTVCFSVESFSRMHRCFLPTVRVGTKMQSEPLAKKVDEIDRSVHSLKKDLHLRLNATQIALKNVEIFIEDTFTVQVGIVDTLAKVLESQAELMELGKSVATRTELMELGNATRTEFMELGKSVATRTELMELQTEFMELSAKMDVNAAKMNSNDSKAFFLILANTVIALLALLRKP